MMSQDRLNVPSYLERFFRAFDVKGLLPEAFTPEVQLGVQIADLTDHQYGWLKREQGFMGGANVGTVAGTFGGVQIANPTGGTKLVYDAYLTVINTTAASIQLQTLVGAHVLNIATDISSRIQVTDTRQRQGTVFAGPSAINLYQGNDAVGLGVTAMIFDCPASAKVRLGPVCLTPNTGWTVERNTLAVVLSAFFEWRERDLESTEF